MNEELQDLKERLESEFPELIWEINGVEVCATALRANLRILPEEDSYYVVAEKMSGVRHFYWSDMCAEISRWNNPKGPRALTVHEMRAEFLAHVRMIANERKASMLRRIPPEQRTDQVREAIERAASGTASSILAVLDGVSSGVPAFNITPAPHPDWKFFVEGENFWDEEPVINDCYLRDLFYK